MTTNGDKRVELALAAAQAGGAVAHKAFRGELTVETKTTATDVVTEADHAAQAAVINAIRETYPEEPIVGEEGDGSDAVPDDGPSWLVDPIDGTSNFVRGTRAWVTSVAALRDGEPVAAANVAPALGDTYTCVNGAVRRNETAVSVSAETDLAKFTVVPTIWWPRDRRAEYARACREIVERFGDLRRIGSAQLVLSMVASGELEGVFTNVTAAPWDTVAGAFLVRSAGGTVTDLAGERWRHDSRGLVASNGNRHEEVIAAARAVDEERSHTDANSVG